MKSFAKYNIKIFNLHGCEVVMQHLPLFYYATTWVCVDDEPLMTQSMKAALGSLNHIKAFNSAEACSDFLATYTSPLFPFGFLQADTDDEMYGTLAHTNVGFNVTDIARLADLIGRHEEVTAMVLDYQMPGMSGVALAERYSALGIPSVLLTGEAKPDDVIDVMNERVIHCYLHKGDNDLLHKLSMHLKRMTYKYFQLKTLPLLAHLEADTALALSDPDFIAFFHDYCEKNNIVEYYLLDKQGSFLCIDKDGKRVCFVVQTDRSLESWTEMYEAEGDPIASVLNEVKKRRKIPFFGIGKESWQVPAEAWEQHQYPPHRLQGREQYFWAEVEVGE